MNSTRQPPAKQPIAYENRNTCSCFKDLCLNSSKIILYSPITWLQCDCSLPGAALGVSYVAALLFSMAIECSLKIGKRGSGGNDV